MIERECTNLVLRWYHGRPSLHALCGENKHIFDLPLPSNATVTLDEIEGARLEIRATFSWESAQEFGLGGTARLKSMVVWQMNAI